MKRGLCACCCAIMMLAANLAAQQSPMPDSRMEIAPNMLAADINVVAGDTVVFALTAKDGSGTVVANWNSVGTPTTVVLHQSIANLDTLTQSWNADPNGYSYAAFAAPVQQVSANEWNVPKEMFVQGIAQLRFVHTGAERGVFLRIEPVVDSVQQTSARMNFQAGALSNFLVDLTLQTALYPQVYLMRPYEIVVLARDRYLNTIPGPVGARFTARFMGEFDNASPDQAKIFSGEAVIDGPTAYTLVSRIPRIKGTDVLQYVIAYSSANPAIAGKSEDYEILEHAPVPFPLQYPDDHTICNFPAGADSIFFAWTRQTPPDPFTNIQVSRFRPDTRSDTVRYTAVFLDSASLSNEARIRADMNGTGGRLSLSKEEAIELMEDVTKNPQAASANIVWYVEATDGLSTSTSTPPHQDPGGRPGMTLRMIKPVLAAGRMQLAEPWTGPSLDTGVGAKLVFSLSAKDLQGMDITRWDSTGYPIDITLNSTANSDTSEHSWSADPDAYTFMRLELEGSAAQLSRTGPHSWSIPPAAFAQGSATLALTCTKAERNVTMTLSHGGRRNPWQTVSKPMNFAAGKTATLVLDITSQTAMPDQVYRKRPYELVVSAYDAHMNHTEDSLDLVFNAALPAQFDTSATGGSELLFPATAGLRGQRSFLLVSTDTLIKPDAWQKITAEVLRDAIVRGETNGFEVLPHAPYPFRSIYPVDAGVMYFVDSSYVGVFRWEAADPADPFHGIRVSRFDTATVSDIVKYRMFFGSEDGGGTRTFISDSGGLKNTLTLNYGELRELMISMNPRSGCDNAHVKWHVEASDGVMITESDGGQWQRFWLTQTTSGTDGDAPAASGVALSQNYPNPVSPGVASCQTTIAFSLQKQGPVSLKVYSLLGAELATLVDGELVPGEYRIPFDAHRFPAGMYVYTLRAGGTLLSRTLTLLR